MPGGSTPRVIDLEGLDALLAELRGRGWATLGPVVRGGVLEQGPVDSWRDLPVGWAAEQEAGTYRLRRRGDEAVFGVTNGAWSPKRELLPPELRLWRAEPDADGAPAVAEDASPRPRRALVGVRPCDVAAIRVQDRVLAEGRYADRDYAERRAALFVVAANCVEAGATCFCASMGSGPRAEDGHDIALTELLDGGHRFLAEAGSAQGEEVLAAVPSRPAAPEDLAAAEAGIGHARATMGRELDTAGLHDVLLASLEHPRWDDVAARCLACSNCTLVCPTCFCTAVDDTTDLVGDGIERRRTWDSCFSLRYSHMHGGSTRRTPRARYRQWLTHKLATWEDQFGTAGCVGCGRCIAWCPVGIDITAEARALREIPEATHAHA